MFAIIQTSRLFYRALKKAMVSSFIAFEGRMDNSFLASKKDELTQQQNL